MLVEFVIYGEPASKSNSRKMVTIKGKPRLIKSAKALAYSKMFNIQCPKLDDLLEGDLCVNIDIWYATRRPDLDESLILDLMQGKIYKNDRQIKEKHIFWHLDRDKPRTKIKVEHIS